MREHQIVITLKPDQFLEVQRLARAANAKSMGIFVRQRLLAALGIETDGTAVNPQELDSENIEMALGQIRRLHGELKTFVAESLSLYNFESQGDQGEQHWPEAGSQSAYGQTAAASDNLENMAEKTFAISPRLGALGESGSAAADGATGNQRASTGAEAYGRHDPARKDQHRYHHPHAASDLMDVPFRPSEQAKAQSGPVINDPLEKLLPGESEYKRPEPAADQQPAPSPLPGVMDESQVPYSISERNQQMVSQTTYYFMEEEHNSVPPEEPDYVQASATEQLEASSQAYENQAPAPVEQPAATSVPVKPQDDNSAPVIKRSGDHSSFSGSPPPKRRRV